MKRQGFDAAYELAEAHFAALAKARNAPTDAQRLKWEREARRLGNKITPAAKQAAASIHSQIAIAALDWLRRHGGEFNYAAFFRHCEQRGIGQRRYQGGDKSRPGQRPKDSAGSQINAWHQGESGSPAQRLSICSVFEAAA